MKIAVVGAGAMGSLYGGKLSAIPGNEVYMLDVWKDHVDAINANGLLMEEDGEFIKYPVKATTDASTVGVCDLVLVFVKSTLTKSAVENNRAVFGPDTLVLTLQNGLGNVDLIAEVVGDKNIIAGTTACGANMIGPGKMRHAGTGATIIGELTGETTDRLKKVVDMITEAGLMGQLSNNVTGLIWDKLIVNVGINAICGILDRQNGKLLEYPEMEFLMEAAVAEAIAVAKAKGVELGFADPLAHVKDVAKATGANVCSMLADVRAHRKTEIDMINGAIVREGAKVGVATPVNMVLSKLIENLQRPVEA